jgi:hypothetical protein
VRQEGFPRLRIEKLETLPAFGHFIAAFTAADIQNEIRVAPFCELICVIVFLPRRPGMLRIRFATGKAYR